MTSIITFAKIIDLCKKCSNLNEKLKKKNLLIDLTLQGVYFHVSENL